MHKMKAMRESINAPLKMLKKLYEMISLHTEKNLKQQ